MPKLGEAMEEGTILKWLVADGAEVALGQPLVEIETDKANGTYAAEATGTLTRLAAEGSTLRVGETIARIAPAAAPPPRAPTAKGDATVEEPTRLGQSLARRVSESAATVPQLALSTDVRMDLCLELADRVGEVSVEAMVVKAAALALREHPLANAAYRDARFEQFARVNVGVVTAEQIPIVFDADSKSLGELSREIGRLSERVGAGTIAAPELAGGTFTVASLEVERFVPLVTPPQAAALGVGAVRRAAVGDDSGRVFNAHAMTATLACDHRILHGPAAAAFLAAVRANLQEPLALSR